MRLHVEALSVHDDGSRMMAVNEPGGRLAPRFFLGRTLAGNLWRFRTDVPHRRPFLAAVEAGHAVSVCASVRITRSAHEAGVETLPAYRQRGHAVSVVAAWAMAVRKLGALPLYSTSWDNIASRQVAASLGMQMLGVGIHLS